MSRIAVYKQRNPESIERADNPPAYSFNDTSVMFFMFYYLAICHDFFCTQAQLHPHPFVQVKQEYFGKQFYTAYFECRNTLAGKDV